MIADLPPPSPNTLVESHAPETPFSGSGTRTDPFVIRETRKPKAKKTETNLPKPRKTPAHSGSGSPCAVPSG